MPVTSSNYSRAEDRPYADGREARVWHLYVGDVKTRLANYKDSLSSILRERGVRTMYDVACATGVDSIMLIEEGFRVTSSDAVAHFVARAAETKRLREVAESGFAEWQVGTGDWLELSSAQVSHPARGYDSLLCIGNSFTCLPDFEGGGRTHRRALRNFWELLRPGGVLVIDHRNYDYALVHGAFPPNSHTGSIYYNSERIFNVRTELVKLPGVEVPHLVFNADMDVTGTELVGDGDVEVKERGGAMVPALSLNTVHCYMHTVKGFEGLLREVFGEGAEHWVMPDFKTAEVKEGTVPNYWVHVIVKTED